MGTHFGYFQDFLHTFTKHVALTSRLINVTYYFLTKHK